MRSNSSPVLVPCPAPLTVFDVFVGPLRPYAVQGFVAGVGGAVAWIGWCVLTVALAILLGRWLPLDIALAAAGLGNVVTGMGLGILALRGLDADRGGMA